MPILEKDDGGFLGESWEINRYLDRLDGNPLLDDMPDSSRYESWYKPFAREYDLLCYPRMLALNLPELASEGAREYFRSSRKEILGMTLAEALAQTAQFKPVVEAALEAIAPDVNPHAGRGMNVEFDDFYLFPLLRNLTMVKGLRFPAALTGYLENLSAATKAPLYSDVAV